MLWPVCLELEITKLQFLLCLILQRKLNIARLWSTKLLLFYYIVADVSKFVKFQYGCFNGYLSKQCELPFNCEEENKIRGKRIKPRYKVMSICCKRFLLSIARNDNGIDFRIKYDNFFFLLVTEFASLFHFYKLKKKIVTIVVLLTWRNGFISLVELVMECQKFAYVQGVR